MPRVRKVLCERFTPAEYLAEASLMMIEALGTCIRQQVLQL